MSTSTSAKEGLRSVSLSTSYETNTGYESTTDESGESHTSTSSAAIDKFYIPTITKSAHCGEPISALPERVFGTDRYPSKGRVNTYSKLEFLIDIVDILAGSEEMPTILNSQFGHLFRLPVSRCSLSRKLVHNILCRQVLSHNTHDAWFTFGGTPLRFSIAEFANVTRLNCDPIPDHTFMPSSKVLDLQGTLHWKTLIGDKPVVKISELIRRLRTDTSMPGWKRLQLALVVIVDGVILCNTQPVMASLEVVEMVKDVPFFLTYPWGRHSFYLTLRMMKVGDRIKDKATLIQKLKQKSLVLHGFPLAIQLWLFKAIPGLLRYLPHSDCKASFLDQTTRKLPRLMTYHTSNIFLLENERPIIAFPRICGAVPRYHGDVMVDPCIGYLERCLDNNKIFKPEDWTGGDRSLPPLCLCATDKSSTPTTSKIQPPVTVENIIPPNSMSEPVHSCHKCSCLAVQYEDLLNAHTNLKNYMPVFVAAEVEKLRASFKSEIQKTIHETFSTKRPDPLKIPVTYGAENKPPQYRLAKNSVAGPSTFKRVGGEGVRRYAFNKRSQPQVEPTLSRNSTASKKFVNTVHKQNLQPANITLNQGRSVEAENACSSTRTRKRKLADMPLQRTYETRTRLRLGREVPPITTEANCQKTRSCPQRLRDHLVITSPTSDLRGYNPFPVSSDSVVKKFVDLLQTNKKRGYILDGHKVLGDVFLRLLTPQKWVLTSHMNLMVSSLWKRRYAYFKSNRMTVTDCYFTQLLTLNFKKFIESDPTTFQWPQMLQSYVIGQVTERNDIGPWGEAVDTIYAPMNWGDIHWVGLVISLKHWDIKILDPLPAATGKHDVRFHMSPVINMLPYLIRYVCKTTTAWCPRDGEFTYETLHHNSANTRTGDCGPLTIKFLELHSHQQSLDGITPEILDRLRLEFAINVYSDFVAPLER